MEPLKNVYNDKFFDQLTRAIEQVLPDFAKASFIEGIYDSDWQNKELKQRMRHIVLSLKPHLPKDYRSMIATVLEIVQQLQKHNIREGSFEYMFFPEFVELYGLEDFTTSIDAFEKITQFTSCEFAVRPFISKYPEKMMAQMLLWTKHKHPMVRRLSSEGSRPRLP